jgi:hypothetical protein
MPLVLNVPWGKGLTTLSSFEGTKREKRARAEQKKEKPRGNGAHGAYKT